jgi:hypothetical protein
MSPDDNKPDFDKMNPKEMMNWMEKLVKEQGEVEPPGFQERKGDGMKLIELGKIAGLRLTAHWTALVGFVLLWIGVTIAVIFLLEPPPEEAILGSLIVTVLHYFSELWHQLGHAWAARRTGYPMIGVRYWWILGASIYPKDEPELPGSIHIRRALGGPAASFLLAIIFYILTMTTNDASPIWLLWVLPVMFLDNFFVFALGAFLPLGFTDGSTILRWRGK